jgi:PAS domain S-box-containing protein
MKTDWKWDKLDPLERRVAELLLQGKSNAAICAEVFLSRARVQECIKRILIKTGAESTRAAIALLVEERENQTLLGVLGQARAGVVIVQDRVVKFANRSAQEEWGYDLNEIEGMPLIELVASRSRELVAQQYELRMRGEPLSESYRIGILCKGGQERDVTVASAGMIRYKGNPALLAIVTTRPSE